MLQSVVFSRKAEERRFAELEEERQRDLERQKLEAEHDYQATLQRQSAQREMELAREREWQKRRKEELEISKSKLAGEVGTLKQKWRSLNVELEALVCEKIVLGAFSISFFLLHRQTSILGRSRAIGFRWTKVVVRFTVSLNREIRGPKS